MDRKTSNEIKSCQITFLSVNNTDGICVEKLLIEGKHDMKFWKNRSNEITVDISLHIKLQLVRQRIET